MAMTAARVVTFTAREKAELLDVPLDGRPLGPAEIAGRTLATLISPGTELHSGYLGTQFPNTPGYAAVFEITAIGEEVTDRAVGERVFAIGGHRSIQRTASQAVLPIPASLSAEEAVFARLMGVSMTTLVTTKARPPALVMVSGLGPVGHLAAQIFAAAGYRVIAVDPITARREALAAKGVECVYASAPLDDPEIAGRVHLVVECSGHEQAALDACRIVGRGGEVVMIGVPWVKRTELTAYELLNEVFHRYVHLRSGWEWELPVLPRAFGPGSVRDNYIAALDWLAEGRVRVDGLYERVEPSDCQEVYQDLLKRPGARLSCVFDWTRSGRPAG